MTATAAVRTPQRPMAFTPREFWRGAVATWCAGMLVLVVVLVVVTATEDASGSFGSPFALTTLYLVYGLPVGGMITAATILVISPPAWILGRALARVRSILVHVVAWTATGALVGTAVVVLVPLAGGNTPRFNSYAALMIALCAVSVVAGWAWTARRALRADASAQRCSGSGSSI